MCRRPWNECRQDPGHERKEVTRLVSSLAHIGNADLPSFFPRRRHLDYTFNMKKMTSFEGDTGVYLQYAHVRLASMERKNPNVVLPEDSSLINTDLLVEDRAHDIVYLLALYPDVVRTAYTHSEPSTIVTYAFRLAHAISGAWDGRTSALFDLWQQTHH